MYYKFWPHPSREKAEPQHIPRVLSPVAAGHHSGPGPRRPVHRSLKCGWLHNSNTLFVFLCFCPPIFFISHWRMCTAHCTVYSTCVKPICLWEDHVFKLTLSWLASCLKFWVSKGAQLPPQRPVLQSPALLNKTNYKPGSSLMYSRSKFSSTRWTGKIVFNAKFKRVGLNT